MTDIMGEPEIIEKLIEVIDIRKIGESPESGIKFFEDLKKKFEGREIFLSYDRNTIDSYDNYYYEMIVVERRLETPLEQSNREILEARRAAEKEKQERKTLEELKMKYENNRTIKA